MNHNVFEDWLNSSYLTQNNQLYIDQIYKIFLRDPNSVDESWRNIFKQLFKEKYFKNEPCENIDTQDMHIINQPKYDISFITKLSKLINSFRMYGHQYSILDPLNLSLNKFKNHFLELEYYKFTDQDLQKTFDTTVFDLNMGHITLESIYRFLKKMYCSSIGIEYMHIPDTNKLLWIQNHFESKFLEFNKFNNIEQEQFLSEIIAAEGLERYLGTRFPGIKRFSLEGCDVLIPMLKEIVRYSAFNYNITEIFIGMTHRGRLNVLVNVLGKNLEDLFNEFCNKHKTFIGSGDVKYHQGLCSNIRLDNFINSVNLSLLFNPSHLEIITPIVMGSARARIDQLYTQQLDQNNQCIKDNCLVLPIAIHGDAAISAQGVIQESFNMSNTYAYNVKGTIHIIVNNQIGFTTSNIYNIRSTPYCTDIAKMVNAPILHVNADDVHAVIFAARFALDFRNQFKNDIVIDLVCYRRHGHNEADEPSVTQPIMYQKIKNHPTVSTIYSDFLKKTGIIDSDLIQSTQCLYRTKLEKKESLFSKKWYPTEVHTTRCINKIKQNRSNSDYKKMHSQYLKELAYNISNIPSNIMMHDRVNKIYNDRIDMALGKRLFDWGGAEILAYATLLDQGYSIRISGEDVARGTFFHRHAIIHDQNNGSTYIPLMHVSKKQGSFFVWDSVLSEESALAFEYGYAHVASNSTLVIWEAQFGDFSNGAQIVIDQFISSSEQKWEQLCGLVMLLPHGYEGQGPEHSSCRIERYLQLCAEYNMTVCIPSTPAQIFHVLRQHAYNNIQKPLVIVSPKSLLRHAMVTNSIKDLAYGSFSTVFDEINTNCITNQINRVIICTGKVYYDLIQKRDQTQQYHIAIIRVEQLYPFPDKDIERILQLYSHIKDFIWCQEEPENQGAWYYIQRCFIKNFLIKLNYVGRPDSAAPAAGYFSEHQKQQNKIINDALDLH